MSRTASISDDGSATAADVDIQAAAKRLDSGRSIGSDDTASTDPSSTGTYDDQYDPYNKSSGANSSGSTSVRAPPANPWAPKMARNSSTKKSASVTKTTTRLRHSRSDEDLERLETFVKKAEEEHSLVIGQSGGSARNTNKPSSAPTAQAATGREGGAFDDDLQAMMNGVEERRRARREAGARVDDTEAEDSNGITTSSRGRLAYRHDDIGTQKMSRRRSSSAPPGGSNRSLFSDDETDDEDTVHSDGDYRKTIRWTDHHGESLEDVCILDPAKSEGGMRRLDKLRSLYGDDDDYLEEDEEAQYDSDETPSSDEDGDDYFVGDNGNGPDNDHAEVSMVFDTQFIESDDIDLGTADASLSLVDAMAAFSSPHSGSNPGGETSRSDDSRKKGSAGRRSRRPKRDQVQEGSFTLDDLADVQAIATAVIGGEPDAGASTSCFGEVSMDLSEISAEMNDELNDLQPIVNKPKKKTMPSITEDSMNVFPDPELVTSKDKAINTSVNVKNRNDLPVPASVVMQPLAPARKKRSSFTTSPTSSPNATKAILATKPIDVLDGGNDSFADFANWGNDSFDANTSSSYKTTKKQHHHQQQQQQQIGNIKREPRSNPAATTATSTSTPTRPAVRPIRFHGTGNNSAGLVSTAGGRRRKVPPPSQSRQLRPPGSKGPVPPSRHQPQQQRQQHGRRSSSDNRERPRRSSSANSDTARKATAAVASSSSVSRSNASSSNSSKPSKGKSMLGGLFTRNSQTSRQSKKLVGDEEVGILGHVDSSLGDSLNSLGDLAGLDSYFDPPAASSRLVGGNPNAGSNLAASIARNSQRQQQQRRRNNMKGRSLDDSDAALFAHINDGQQSRQSRRDSLDDLFVKDKW